jgi:two-component system, chemotaxis family, CheB/CheR fusion protein
VLTADKTLLPYMQISSPEATHGFNVPGAAGKLAKTSTRSSSAKRGSNQNYREHTARQSVLVVDDVSDVTEMIALFLKHAGYDVTTSNSAGQALQLASDRYFDLVISDIGMPEMNGYQLAESLRASNGYQTTPLIAVTGYTEYDDRGRSLRAGFDAHLTKPINPSQLLELVGRLIAGRDR